MSEFHRTKSGKLLRVLPATLGKLPAQRAAVPLDRLISQRAQHYRGTPDWEAWLIVKRPDWC